MTVLNIVAKRGRPEHPIANLEDKTGIVGVKRDRVKTSVTEAIPGAILLATSSASE